MPGLDEHERDCMARLGKPFTQVHRALDSYVRLFGAGHRFAMHHREGIEVIRARFGDKAAAAAECHVRLDCGGEIPNREDYQTGKVDWMGQKVVGRAKPSVARIGVMGTGEKRK